MSRSFLQRLRNPDFVMPNHPIANNLTKAKDRKPTDIVVNKKENIRIRAFTITCELGDVEGPVLTAYDRQIYDAICTLYDVRSVVFTANMVWRVANGMSANRDPHKEQVARVERSIKKLCNTMVSFDASEELQERGLKTPYEIKGPLMSCNDKGKLRVDGKEYKIYWLLELPIILEHSDRTNQVLRVPYGLLNVKKPDGTGLRATEENMALKGILIRRISWQKKKRRSFTILLDSIAEDLGKKLKTRKERQLLRTEIETMLSFWKREGFIRDYEPHMKVRTIAGYKVKV